MEITGSFAVLSVNLISDRQEHEYGWMQAIALVYFLGLTILPGPFPGFVFLGV